MFSKLTPPAVNALLRRVAALAAVAVLGAAAVPATAEPDPLSSYYFNSLVTQNRTTKAMAHLWLNQDHSYVVVFDLGPQSRPLDIDGPYRVEAWMGTYTVKKTSAGVQVCLTPEKAPPRKIFVVRDRGELFAAAGCYDIAPRRIGETWVQSDSQDRQYDLWFLANR